MPNEDYHLRAPVGSDQVDLNVTLHPSIDRCALQDSRERETHSIQQVVAKMKAGFEHISKYVRGYDQVMVQTQLALATGNHHLLVGPTGLGKSYYARAVLNLFASDVKRYENQITLETTEDQLYGFIPFDRIKDGTGRRNVESGIVASEVAFLDEIFDGRDELLRSLLWTLSDRRYKNGDQMVQSPLRTVIACGNYVRKNEKTGAFLDRFIFQSEISPNLSTIERQAILRNREALCDVPSISEAQKISTTELSAINRHVDEMNLSHDVAMYLDAIISEYNSRTSESSVDVSGRTFRQMGRIIKAHALLRGQLAATLDDLSCLALLVPVHLSEADREAFRGSWSEVMRSASGGEANVVSTLGSLTELTRLIERGEELCKLTLSQHLLTFLGITSAQKCSYQGVLAALDKLQPSLPYFRRYRDDLRATVQEAIKQSRAAEGQDTDVTQGQY